MDENQLQEEPLNPEPPPDPNQINACPPGLLPAEPITLFTDLLETYLRGLARGLSEYLETPVSATLDSTTQVSCAEYLADTKQDVCRVILDLDDGRGQAFLGLSPGLVSRALAVLLVVPAGLELPHRDSVTDIEFHVMHRFFELLVEELRAAWAPSHLNFQARPLGQPGERPVEPSEDPLLVMNCRIKFASGEETLRLAIPALLVRLVALDRERELALQPAVKPYPGILDALRQASLELEAVLAGSSLRMSDLLAIEPGEILMLGQAVGAPLECRVNGQVKFRGELIQTGTRRAMQVA